MLQQILRRARHAVGLQIGLCGIQPAWHRHQMPHRHARLQHIAVAQADVHILFEHIHLPVHIQQLQRQLGMARGKGRQQRCQYMAAKGGHAGNAQPALQLAVQQRQIGLGFFQFAQHRRHTRQVALSRFGQRNLPGGAGQQPHAQLALQPRNVLAGCGRRHAQLAGSRGDGAPFQRFDEGFDGAQIRHVW